MTKQEPVTVPKDRKPDGRAALGAGVPCAASRCNCRRSAGFQPGVSPISNRQRVNCDRRAGTSSPLASWKPCDQPRKLSGDTGWRPALRVFALALPLFALSQDAFAIGQTQYVTMAKERGSFSIVEGKAAASVYVDN